MNTASKPGPQIHTHREPTHRTSRVLFCSVAKKARTKQGECGALVVKGHISNPPVSAQAVARGATHCASQELDRGAHRAA